MAAFERIKSGIPKMDEALDNIRLGDNVVFRVTTLEEFKVFLNPYIEQAKIDKRNIIYFRFASHAPLVEDCPEIKRIDIPLSHRFETFTVDIHNVIADEGLDAFYVFDCLSELQAAWATDLMMGNFFRVTCPFLFTLDTVAYFPVLRGMHSTYAINKIKNTAQVFIDVYSDDKNMYVRPEKVWNRHDEKMLMPHIYDKDIGDFYPIIDGVQSSRFYQILGKLQRSQKDQHSDYWDRFFNKTKALYESGQDVKEYGDKMCNIMMTRDEKMRLMVKENFTLEDYFEVREHMIGTGMIGGKSCGMLLSRAIVRNKLPEIYENIEPHDSFYVGSDVYYTYIVDNDFWDLRVKQRTEEGFFTLAEQFSKELLSGSFDNAIEEQFRDIIEYYGQDPYIIRSSSILEDGFGNAFAGKYESVFCANRGTAEERLLEFENAVRTVYASTMSLSALEYRKRRGLEKRDEQMALLIQRVSGSYYGDSFMPCAAGVGYSYSPYKFIKEIDQSKGMLRLVMGLGTSAVDRTEGSYPRLVSLGAPEKTVYTNSADMHKFSQRKIEVVDTKSKSLKQLEVKELLPNITFYHKTMLLDYDYEAETHLREVGRNDEVMFVSCRGLVKRPEIMGALKNIMACIQAEYQHPVDIEFAINLSENDEYMINLLQCRPLQVHKDLGVVQIPSDIGKDRIILESYGCSMGLSRSTKLDIVVYVNPIEYYNMPHYEKVKVANLISRINGFISENDKRAFLMCPGRIGTSSPELGVPTTFADISGFEAICEMEERKAGYNPELSYGSHMFQDLVEQDILYTAVFSGKEGTIFNPEYLKSYDNITEKFEGGDELKDIVQVYSVSDENLQIFNDLKTEHFLLTG
ncbi:Pyruvate phosphate dikinase, PEP/pyruvate binding domain [Pseudobutyrivibrio sp. YE44]|uniref:PEP/pyruvate-binding domain-containing protein n=1 Tax=Pseudobutyrivibrio sp. YE44 TaxID=1520802 RepID=UPI00088AACA5|nr:PEP/pyruvate-binding domain-containing protein [Pseudobutyrivibrio sp. YE44]SDB47939.1 Pyruvate phosphate dikinase, PEP/pyruvate binding domain [Pseudobutyrivibrio sp. YE44]